MDPILLIGAIIALAAILTWVLPAGRFERTLDSRTGRTLVVPGSYEQVPRNPVGPWGAVLSIPQGLIEAAEVVFFVLLAGGALAVVEATGAIGNFLNRIMRRFGHHPLLVLAIVATLFLIGGASNAMYEEILPFIPVLCLLMRRLGLDTVMAVGVSLGTATVASSFSPFNALLMGLSQPIAELPLFSGFAFRSVVFAIALCLWGAYIGWYATRYGCAPATSDEETPLQPENGHRNGRDIGVLIAMNAGMAVIVLGGILLHWGLRHFGAVFVVMAIAAGWAGGLGWRGTSEQFAEGLRRITLGASLVGFARAISVVLANGMVLDTIANALFSPLRNLPLSVSASMMFVSESVLAFPMPSDSGRAVMSLPILIPLADLLGMSRQMVVSSYLYSCLISGLMTPTAGSLLAMLAVAGVSFGKWLRFVGPPVAILFLLSIAAMIAGVQLGIQ